MTCLLVAWLPGQFASGTTGTWILDANGNWTGGPANWSGGVIPNGVGDIATFRNDISAGRTVTLNAPITLGGLNLNDALGSSAFTFAGTNALTFDNTAGSAFFSKFGGATDIWQAPLVLPDSVLWNIFAGTLQVNGASNAQVSYTGSGDTVKNGSGTLQLNIDSTSGAGYTGNWVLNLGSLTFGGANSASPSSLGLGTGGITLNGSGNSGLAILNLNNNGTGSDTTATWTGNNDVILQGGARITVDRNFLNGANDRVNHVLDNLTMNGGVLAVTSANSHRLTFSGTTTLAGQTSSFDVGTNATATLANLTLSGALTDGANTRALIKEGAGRLAITNTANTFDGATAIKDGILQLGSGANLGGGSTFVNGGVLSIPDTATLNAVSAAGGIKLVGQLGISRYALPSVAYHGSATIDASNPVAVTAPAAGMILGIDGVSGTSSTNSANIDLAYVAGGSSRVWLGNAVGFDRTYTGTLTNGAAGDLRLTAGANNLILSGANSLGGAAATNNLVIGYDFANPIGFTGNYIGQATALLSGTTAGSGVVSVRANNAATLGTVTVNRGVTLNINGTVTTPVGTGAVTALGGTISTDNTSAAQYGNTSFKLFAGSTLLLDNRAVTTSSTDRRLTSGTSIALNSSNLQFAGDGGAAAVATQNLGGLSFAGGNILSIGRDGTTAGARADLLIGSALSRTGKGTLVLTQLDAQTATLGTGSATSRILATGTAAASFAPAFLLSYGGTDMRSSDLPTPLGYDVTNGYQAATLTTAANVAALQSATTAQFVDFNGVTGTSTMSANASVLGLRLRTTAASQVLANGGFTVTVGSAAPVGNGAGLYLAHTSNDTVTHTANFAFGSQEALIFAASTGGTSGVVELSGTLTGTGGLTRFGPGILRLSGANNITGTVTLNSGETRLNHVSAAGLVTNATPTAIEILGGSVYFNNSSTRYNNDVSFSDDARFGNVNVSSAGFNNLVVNARSGSSAPVVVWHQDQSGSNFTTAYGGLTLNGPAQLSIVNPLQINGAISGTGSLEKFMNDRLVFGGDSSGFAQPVTVWAGALLSLNSNSSAKPIGSGAVTIQPGGLLQVAAANNLNPGQLTINSDFGGISGLAMTYSGDPALIAGGSISVNSTAPWKGFLAAASPAFNYNLDQSASGLWGGGVYLGAALSITASYTGTLTPTAANEYLLGTGQGALQVNRPLTGASNSAVIGLSMTGANRADQVVNNGGGSVVYNVPMTYGGTTTINPNVNLRLGAPNALSGTGSLVLNGGVLRGTESTLGQSKMLAPVSVSNAITLTSDSSITIEDAANDLRLTGNISLAPGSTGVLRTITFNSAQRGTAVNNAGVVYLDGGISDGAGGSGNHLVKSGNGAAMVTGPMTYTGSTTVTGGFLGINSDADLASSSQIVLSGGGLAIWENSFTTDRNYTTAVTTNGWFDVAGGLTFTQGPSSTIEGGGFVMKRGLGTVVLNGINAQTGIWVGDGVLQANSQAALGNPAEAGGTAIQLGGDFNSGADNSTRYTGGTLRANFTGATNRGIAFNNNGNTTFSGGLDVTAGNALTVNGVISQGTEFDYGFKTGAGTLIVTGNNTWRQWAMTNGTLQFGTSTPWANSTATASENTIIEMLGGTIRAVNIAGSIALANGTSTTTYNYGGGMHLRMASGAGFAAEFAADNLIRVNQGTLVLETEGGTVLGNAGFTNAGRLIVTNAVNSGLARASALNNGIFGAHLIGADSAGTAFFLTDDAATGFKAYTGATVSTLSGSAPTAIGNITSAQNLTGSNNSIYILRTTADISGGSLKIGAIDNVRSGGILINGSNTISSDLIFDPTLAGTPGAGTPGEGLIYVKSGETATISGNVTANALTKFGDGTLVLSGNNLIAGDVSVQDGTLKLGGGSPFSRMNSELNLNAGAALDLNATSIAVETLSANNRAVSTSEQVGGQLTNSSATQATLTVASPVSSSFSGTLNSNLKLEKAGAGNLTLNGFSAATPDAGNNTYTGGTDIYGTSSATITGASTVNGSATVTVTSTAGLAPGTLITGTGITAGTYIASITGATTFTMSQNATATNSGQTFTSAGGLTLNNAPFGLGGYGGSTTGDVNLYSGNLNLLFSNGTTGVNSTHGQQFSNQTIKVGAEASNGVTLNVRGPGTVYVNQGTVSSNGLWGQGNLIQVGALNLSNNILTLNGGNLYRLKVAGTTSIQGAQASLQTSSDAVSFQLDGQVTGSGALNKLGDGALRTLILTNASNDFSGGLNIQGGDVQNPTSSASALGSGPVRVFPEGTLRLAANTSVDGSKLVTYSRVNALGAVALDDNFNPTVLTSSNFSSVYNTTLQLAQPYFNQALDLSSIGDGRAFLGSAINTEVRYLAPTLGAGTADAWNPGTGVYRLVGGVNNLGLDGVPNVLTGSNYLQVGPQRNNVLGAATNTGNAVIIRTSNNYTGGTQVTEGTILISEVGGSPIAETAFGSGNIEVYGELRYSGSLGSNWNATTSSPINAITLRPGALLRLIDGNIYGSGGNLVAGDQGRWGNSQGIDLNGAQFRFDGAANWQSVETIGDVTARKGGFLQIFRNSAASSAQLNTGNIDRIDHGTVTITYNAGFLGINNTTPLSYERVTATAIDGTLTSGAIRGGTTTNGSGVINGGIVAPWLIDGTANTFLGYNTTGTGTGFQPLASTASPGAGEISYNQLLSGASLGALGANDIVDVTTAAKTLAANTSLYALRSNQNISPTASFNTLTINSGGWIMNGGTINPTGAVTAGVVSPMTINFGAGGAGEAILFVPNTTTIQAQMVAAQGLTKFGSGQLNINSINPGIDGPVTINAGTVVARVPFSGSGTPLASGGGPFGGQDVILNGGTLQLDPLMANLLGTATEIASTPRATAFFNSNIFVRGDAGLNSNAQANYVRIQNLTFENAGGAVAMDGNGVISLSLQSGIWVDGTTTLIPQAVLNMSANSGVMATFAGQVTGAADLEKYGNGTVNLVNPTNNYSGGTVIWGSTAATRSSIVAAGIRGAGTPFGTGSITVNPGGLVRISDSANIAGNAVNLKSDGIGLAGLGIAHNGALPTITTGVASPGQVHIESTGPFAGVIALDYGFYSQNLNLAAIPGGNWWLGNSTQAEAFYFNASLGASANGKYLLGGGGGESGLDLGGVLVSGTRFALFDNVITGGTASTVRSEIGALTADLFANGPSFVNGNSGFTALLGRNPGLAGDTRVNTNSTLAIGNNFALGSGRLILNGGTIRYDFGPVNFQTTNVTLDNDVVLQGDFSTSSGNEWVLAGNVAMHDGSAGATRIWNLAGSGVMAVGLTAGSSASGVISGNDGSNLIKRGAQVVSFRGTNTYQGYTQIDRGEVVVAGNVAPGVAGALGISTSPIVLGVESTNNAGSLGIGGKYNVSRDILVAAAAGTGLNLIEARTNETALVSGGISVAAGATLSLGGLASSNTLGTGGALVITGPISGAGAVAFGTASTAPNANGPVSLMAVSNGFLVNTYSGGTTFNSTRVEIGGDTYYTNTAATPTIISGPFGTGAMTWTSGESGNGATFLAVGGARTIVNGFNPTSSAANATWKFAGSQALTFTRDWNINSDTSLRNRTLQVINPYQPVTFSGNLSNSSAAGSNLLKTGSGLLILTGTNTQANLSTSDGNYGTGLFIDDGIVRVSSDAALGSTTTLAAAGSHLAGPADVQIRGGYLSVATGFTTARQFVLATNSNGGFDVAANQTLALSTATRGAFGIRKVGPGTLALNSNANTITGLTLGGAQQLGPNVGFFSHTGGIISTTATSGTPFVTGSTAAVTVNSGALSLVGGASAQALSIGRFIYGPAAGLMLNKGTSTTSLTASEAATTSFQRSGSFNSVNYGTLTIMPSALANLGTGGEQFLITNSGSRPTNSTLSGGDILAVPSIFVALSGSGQDANFARYDATNGFMQHNVPTVTTLGATAASNVGDISTADTAGAGPIDIGALRISANVGATDGTTLIRINNGGLILNGSTAPVVSADTLFGTGTGAGLKEAIVYVRDGQTGTSTLAGNVSALDFTKTGPGALELSGTNNQLNTNSSRLPVVSVQNGTLRFANSGSLFVNANRPAVVNAVLGNYVLNVNEAGTFDLNGFNVEAGGLNGNGTVTSNASGPATLTSRNGFGVDTTFSGQISNGSGTVGLTKTGNGVLTLNGYGSFTGGTRIESGRVTNATGSTSVTGGRLELQTASAIGTGPVTLAGGTLRMNATTLLDGTQTTNEIVDGVDAFRFGGPGGLDVTAGSAAYSNGTLLPANMTSTLSVTTQNALINSLTVNAPMLTITDGLLVVQGAASFNQDTVLRAASSGRLFLSGQVNATGSTITKTGANDVVLTHTEGGASQNTVGGWKVYGGILNPRTADGAANPLGANQTVELNGGSTNYGLLLSTDGDGTAAAERVTTYADTNVRFGSALRVTSDQFVASGSSRIATDRILSNNDDKTVEINNLEVRGALGNTFSYFLNSNNSSIWVDGTTNFERDWHFQADGTAITFNGVISGNGTLSRRSNGATVYFNAENTYNGGTFMVGNGRNLFGSYEGNQVTLSNTAKLGNGHVFLGPIATFQINDAGNLRSGQNIYAGGNLSWPGIFSLAANLTLDQVRLRSLGLGGIQNSATDYYLSASNPSTAVLGLGTIYTQALDQKTIGDGMWFIGSATNMVGMSGSYDAASLRPGLADTYRLGAGGGNLFFGSNGSANVLTDYAGTPSNLVVGGPMTMQNGGAWTTGGVILLQNQNYTGSTTVNRGSTLDFRGTLTTSGMEVFGVVNAAGEAGTFIHPNTGNNIPVTLRPGATLRFDNTAAGVLPIAATQGRWQDSVAIALNDSVVRLQGNAAVEVTETVGAITADNGANRIEVVRAAQGRGTELRTPSISRLNSGTVQLLHNSDQLGTDERVILTGAAPTVTNGMVAPWMVSNSNTEFVTYNADTGFTKAGFTRTQAAATLASSVTASTDRTLFSGAVVLNSGVDFDTYALRLDGNVTLGTANDTGAQLIIGSGGLLANGAISVTSGVVAGSIASPTELLLYNNNTATIGEFANSTTAGQILASSITKFGSGTLQLYANPASNPFTGDIRLQQGALTLDYRNLADVSTVDVTTTIGGSGGNVIFQGAGTTLNLRAGQDGTGTNFTGTSVSFAKGIAIADYLPVATVNVDRSTGALTGKNAILTGGITFGQGTGEFGQILRLDLRNSYNLAVHGTTTLNGRSSISVEDNAYGNTGTSTVWLRGQVTGTGTLIKGASDSKSRILELDYINGLNNYTNGTVLQGGTLRALGRATNVAASANTNLIAGGLGNGDITLMQGTLDLRVDDAVSGAADTDIEFIRYTSGSGVGQNVLVNGSTTINVDRNSYTGTYTKSGTTVTAVLPGGHGFVNGQTIAVTTGSAGTPTTAPTYTLTGVSGNTVTFTDSTGTGTGGTFIANNNSGTSKMLTFNNLTVGSQILTTTGGNGYGLAFGGTTTFLGNPFINNGTELVLGGEAGSAGTADSIRTDGGAVILNKVGTGTLWVHSTNNNLLANVYINAGLLAFGNRAVGNNTATAGTGDIFVNPGASIQVRATTNINTGSGQQIYLTGTPYSASVFRSVGAFTQAQYQNMIVSGNTNSNQVAVLALESNNNNALDFSSIGNGRLYLGANGDRSYGAASIAPGLANLANSVVGGTSTNPVYRFTHTSANTLTINLSAGGIGDVGGTTDVQVGNQAILGTSNQGSTGFVYFQDQNTYTGQTVVSRSMTLRFNQAMSTGNTAGPLGANGSALVDVYGGLRIEGTGNLFSNGSTTTHFYTNLKLHPTSNLSLQDMTSGSNRWGDSIGINLDGSALTADATNNHDNGSDTVGAIAFDRGSRIYLTAEGTGDAFLTAASIARAAASSGAGTGRGTMVFTPSNSAVFGSAASTGVAQQQMIFTSVPTASSTSAVTGMLPGYYMDGNGHRFVKNGANGITPVADGEMVAFTAGMTAGAAVVNVTASGTTTLPDFNPVIFALRGGNSGTTTLNSPTGANNDATITLGGSGADVGAVASASVLTINPNLKFGATGTNEALFYAGGTLTVNGFISAGSITKFGTGGTLVIANDQSDAARGTGNGYSGGWVVNEGNLQLGQFGSAGNAVSTNTIVLNGSQAGSAQLNLRAQPADSLLNYSYSSGKIYAVDFATIDWDPGVDDRVHSIADLEIQQSGGLGNAPANGTLDAYLRVTTNRNRSILSAGTLTVASNAILNVDTSASSATFAAASTSGSYLTNSTSTGLSVASLMGSNRLTKWGDATLYVRGDSSGSFSGPMVIDEGAVFVTHNGSLGTGALTINRYGTLEIGVADYQPTNSSVTYNEGSIERWSVDNARSGTLNLGPATLQVAANQPTTNVAITLSGGGIQAYVNADGNSNAQYSGGVLRILNPGITFNLAADSFIGDRYYEGANGLDSGKQTHDNRPMEEYTASGAILEVQGVISGSGGLTKTGYDTVILSGQNTYNGGTTVTGGKLMLGADNALPTTTTLTTTSNGVLDLNGQNQSVKALANVVTPTSLTNSTSGFITNSGTTVKTLTVGNGATSDFNYGGVIQHNVALTKAGANDIDLTLTNANTYSGDTTINGGRIIYGANQTLPSTTNVTVNANTAGGVAALDLNDKNGAIGSLTFGGTGGTSSSTSNVQTGAGTLTLGGNVTFDANGNPNGSTLSGNLDLGAASRTFAVGDSSNAAEDLTVSATITSTAPGNQSVTKTGSGTLALAATAGNAYDGGTVVDNGTLLVNNTSGSGTGSGTVTVNGGTLGGTGIITGVTTVGDGAQITAGSVGNVTFDNLAFDGNLTVGQANGLTSTWLVDVVGGTGADQIDVGGVLTITDTNLAINWSNLTNYSSFVIASYTSGNLSGFFANAQAENTEYSINGQTWQIAYSVDLGGGNRGIRLTVVPEPEAWVPALAVLALSLLLHRRRRDRTLRLPRV